MLFAQTALIDTVERILTASTLTTCADIVTSDNLCMKHWETTV
jgi:hypothetical protein